MASPFMVEGKVIFGVDTDVVHINFQPFFHYHVDKDVVHEGLECGWHIAKPEEHYKGVIKVAFHWSSLQIWMLL